MKKIYIHTDMEGISGVDRAEMIPKDSPDYGYAVEMLMADVNAAVDGCFLGGATEVVVLDCHANGGNFDMSLLDKRAEGIQPRPDWTNRLDESYFGTFYIGAHAMAGTINGFMDHTSNSRTIQHYSVNGRRMGELARWAMICAHFGVPTIMVSGDLAAVNEAVQFFGDIETAIVKTGISRNVAKLVPLDIAHERIRQAAKAAVEKTEKVRLFKPLLPLDIRVEFFRADYCEWFCRHDNVERLDACTARRVSNSYVDNFLE